MVLQFCFNRNGAPTLEEFIKGLQEFEEDHKDKKVRYDGCLGGFTDISIIKSSPDEDAYISIIG